MQAPKHSNFSETDSIRRFREIYMQGYCHKLCGWVAGIDKTSSGKSKGKIPLRALGLPLNARGWGQTMGPRYENLKTNPLF